MFAHSQGKQSRKQIRRTPGRKNSLQLIQVTRLIMEYASFSSHHLLLFLLLVMHASETGAEQQKNEVQGLEQVVETDPSSYMDESAMVFFTLKDLKLGNSMPIYFRKKDSSSSPRLLSRDEADSIAFSSKELPYLLRFFSFSEDSPQAKAMEDTLRECESESIKGEVKFCVTSLESLLDFARSIFGSSIGFRVLVTEYLTKSSTLFQNYSVLETQEEIPAASILSCHTKPYPYVVLYCHSQVTENRVFKVSLCAENGDRVAAVAVCHMDTSQWSRNHVSFRVLGIEPGTLPVCHFFPASTLFLFRTFEFGVIVFVGTLVLS